MESGKIIDQRAIEELLDKKKKKKGKFIFVFLYFCGMKLFYSLSNKIIYFKFFRFNFYFEFGCILKSIKIKNIYFLFI